MAHAADSQLAVGNPGRTDVKDEFTRLYVVIAKVDESIPTNVDGVDVARESKVADLPVNDGIMTYNTTGYGFVASVVGQGVCEGFVGIV